MTASADASILTSDFNKKRDLSSNSSVKDFDRKKFFRSCGFQLGDTVAMGTFSKVNTVERLCDGEVFAAKMIKIGKASGTFLDRFLPREIKISLEVSHKNIVAISGIVCMPNWICMLMEYAERGTLLDHLCQTRVCSEHKAKVVFHQLSEGVLYLHNRGIVHRDLKLENILLFENMLIKITDLGFARYTQSRIQYMEQTTSRMQELFEREVLEKVESDFDLVYGNIVGGNSLSPHKHWAKNTANRICIEKSENSFKEMTNDIISKTSKNIDDDTALAVEDTTTGVDFRYKDEIFLDIPKMRSDKTGNKDSPGKMCSTKAQEQSKPDTNLLAFPNIGLDSNNKYPSISWLSKSFCGSRAYAPPEILLRHPYNCKSSDVWSMGCILYGMIVGRLPFKHDTVKEERFAVLEIPREIIVTERCKKILRHMLEPVVDQRIKSDDILQHEWLTVNAVPYSTVSKTCGIH